MGTISLKNVFKTINCLLTLKTDLCKHIARVFVFWTVIQQKPPWRFYYFNESKIPGNGNRVDETFAWFLPWGSCLWKGLVVPKGGWPW